MTANLGGGQSCVDIEGRNRVTGEVSITNANDGKGIWTQTLEIGVTNWYRDGLFGGYTRKRTRSMGIVGRLDVFRSGSLLNSYSFNQRGTSSLVTRLNSTTTLIKSGSSRTVTVSGDLDVYGRGGTHCGDTAPDVFYSDPPNPNANGSVDEAGCDIWR